MKCKKFFLQKVTSAYSMEEKLFGRCLKIAKLARKEHYLAVHSCHMTAGQTKTNRLGTLIFRQSKCGHLVGPGPLAQRELFVKVSSLSLLLAKSIQLKAYSISY